MEHILPTPAEFEIAGTYYPPSLLAVILGMIGMALTAKVLSRYRMLRYMYFPNVVLLSLWVIYALFIGTFVIPA